MMTKANQRDDVAGGRLPGAAVRPRLWPLLLGLTAAAVLGVAGCLFIWGRLPDTGMLPSEHGSSAQRARQQARAELAAQEWSAVLRDGLDCAGAMAARLALDVSSGPGAAVVAVAAAPLQPPPKLSQACTTKPRLLIQVWLLQASRAEQADPQPVLVDGHGGLGALSAVARQRLRRAADSQWDSYALTPGQTQGVDQFVPVRGLDAVLLMRFAALAGQSTGRLIDAQSADHGVPIPGAHGLRVATDDTEAQQRVLATATWVLVVAGLAALLLGRYRHQCHRLAMHEQVDALNAAKRGADTLRDAANTALTLAQEASHKALTAEYEANALNQQLHDEIALRRDIEESSPVGLRVIDNSGRLIEVNSAFCMACGWPREELIGKAPPYVYWPSAEIEDRQSQLAAVLNGTVDVDGYRIELVRRGEKAPWLSHVRASRLHSGKGWILSSVDITDERTRQQQIENLIEKLAQQADFFILGEKALQLAHDLTSHVLAIDQNAANLEPLVQPLLGTAHIELASIKNQAGLMGKQLEGFAGDINGGMRYEQFKMDTAVSDAILLESERARGMNAVVSSLVNINMPAQLLARAQLTHVLRNLIANGLKAMQQTQSLNRLIVVNSMVESDPSTPTHPNGRHWLYLTVEDRGCGIPEDKLPTLFDQVQARSDSGRGLGLWLCRRWIERMGGQLTVRYTSQARPTGTVMLIVLPYQLEPTHA